MSFLPSKINSFMTIGISGVPISVESTVMGGIANVQIVGLAEASVKEAKERVRAAITNSKFKFPTTRVLINLAPADLKKSSPAFDLPIAIAILCSFYEQLPVENTHNLYFLGELHLDGTILPIKGLIACLAGIQKICPEAIIVIPRANLKEALLLKNLNLLPVDHLKNTTQWLKKPQPELIIKSTGAIINQTAKKCNDLPLIKGQQHAKRALQIAATGKHNILFLGPPGSGKTMLARYAAYLYPDLNEQEALEVTTIYSIAGLLTETEPLIYQCPFRNPHHQCSNVSIIGGGSWPKPGEVTLAHHGILFLDELPEFSQATLEALRQPLEDGKVTIARASTTISYPANFALIAAANPCPCGFAGDNEAQCHCSPLAISRYKKKFSGPLIDRIDMHIWVPRPKTESLINTQNNQSVINDYQTCLEQIISARNIQKQRQDLYKLSSAYNSQLKNKEIELICKLDADGKKIMSQAINKLSLSARSYYKILKISRSIADLEKNAQVKSNHLAEAIQHRIVF